MYSASFPEKESTVTIYSVFYSTSLNLAGITDLNLYTVTGDLKAPSFSSFKHDVITHLSVFSLKQ